MNKIAMLRSAKERDSNLELYRILVMLLIIAHHYVVNSGITDVMYAYPMSKRTLFLFLFGAWGKSGINCFVLITGYFMCKSQITLRKFAKLIFELQFYKLMFYSLFWLTGYESFTVERLRNLLLPVTNVNSNSFIGCYILFFLCIPFLNTLIRSLSEKQHLLLLLLSLFIYTGLGSVSWINVTMNYVSWFSVLYLIAAYIRLYPKAIFEDRRIWGGAMLASLMLSVLSVVLRLELVTATRVYHYISDSNKILALTNGVASFLFFKNLKMRPNKLVNTVSATTFGILLIHANSDMMRAWLWKDTLHVAEMFGSPWLVVHAIGSVIGIFVVCSLIDLFRIRYIEIPTFHFLDRHWDSLFGWYRQLEQKAMKILHIKE